jgi:hypothetical protein
MLGVVMRPQSEQAAWLRSVILLTFACGLVACKSEPAREPDCGLPGPNACVLEKTAHMTGAWKLTKFRASGAWSEGAQADAAGFLGKQVTIDGINVKLPNGTTCRIVSAGVTIVRDDIETFRSKNGSWERVGLTPVSEGFYEAEDIRFECEEMFWGIVAQKEHDVYLLRVWEVFLQMEHVAD